MNTRQIGSPTPASALPPPALPGHRHIKRYWDPTRSSFAAKILPGEFYVTIRGELITTVLGSCISACIRDSSLGVGGMNHFMLPHSEDAADWGGASLAARYGSFAMEALINDILKAGGDRKRLEVKAFGGANVVPAMTGIGSKNAEFLHRFIKTEGLKLVSSDLGGRCPRKVVYSPASGKVQIKKLRLMQNDTILRREESYSYKLEKQPLSGEVELF